MAKKMNKTGQVWIETVIYILMGMAIIAVLLAFIKPRIDSSVDKAIIEKGISLLNNIDSVINEIRFVSGNFRPLTVGLKKGNLNIDSLNDEIVFLFKDSSYEYSEIGQEIEISGTRVRVLTEENAGRIDVKLILSYKNDLNITYNGKDKNQMFKQASTPYSLYLMNNGSIGNLVQIDFGSA